MAETAPADELRQAAATLRETAEPALRGPWFPNDDGTAIYSDELGSPCVVPQVAVEDAAWIALMSPVLAEPLAAWLHSAATAYDDLNRAADQVLAGKNYAVAERAIRRGPYDMQEALAVARAVNGTQP